MKRKSIWKNIIEELDHVKIIRFWVRRTQGLFECGASEYTLYLEFVNILGYFYKLLFFLRIICEESKKHEDRHDEYRREKHENVMIIMVQDYNNLYIYIYINDLMLLKKAH